MSYVALATVTLSSATSTVTFGSIPASFKDLVIVGNHLGTSNATGGIMRFNGDATSSYSRVFMAGLGTSALAGSGTSTYADIFFPRTTVGVMRFDIIDYSATDKHKTIVNRADTSDYATWAAAGRWANTAAIHTIALSPDAGQWAVGATISLYGIA